MMMVWRGLTLAKLQTYTEQTLTALLLGVAVVLVLVALLVSNPWVKAAVLAWVILP